MIRTWWSKMRMRNEKVIRWRRGKKGEGAAVNLLSYDSTLPKPNALIFVWRKFYEVLLLTNKD